MDPEKREASLWDVINGVCSGRLTKLRPAVSYACAAVTAGRKPSPLGALVQPAEADSVDDAHRDASRFSGFHANSLQESARCSSNWALRPCKAERAAAIYTTKPAADWKDSLRSRAKPAGVLVSGDKSITGGTVTYTTANVCWRLAIHFLISAPSTMPMSKGEVIMVLSSAFHRTNLPMPRNRGCAASGPPQRIMGVLGEETEMIPVTVRCARWR